MNSEKLNKKKIASPYRLFFAIMVTVFFAEAIIMLILTEIDVEPLYEILLDSSILVATTFPFLYLLIYKPITVVAEERKTLIAKLEKALAEVRTLKGLLPICTHCKKVRDDQGFWAEVENYISQNSAAKFSHSICPNCLTEHYPQHAQKIMDNLQERAAHEDQS